MDLMLLVDIFLRDNGYNIMYFLRFEMYMLDIMSRIETIAART